MQFVNFFDPQQNYRRQSSYDDDLYSYLVQKQYEDRLAEEYNRRQAIAQQREEYERQRYLQYLQQQEERRMQQQRLQAQARQRALERERIAQYERKQRALERERRAQYERQLRQQEQRRREQSYHPAFDFFQPFFANEVDHSDEDPDVSVPSDDDLYSTPNKPVAPTSVTTAPVPLPKQVEPQLPAAEPMDLDDFVSNIFTHFLGLNEKEEKEEEKKEEEQQEQPQKEEQSQSEQSEPSEPQSEPSEPQSYPQSEPSQPEQPLNVTQEQLDNIKSKLQNCIDTYERLFSSESSGSDSEYNQTAKNFTSRIKILHKVQYQLEKLYTDLDGIKVPSQLKKLKHELTSKSVTISDKVDDLIRVLEDHRTGLLEKELKNKTPSQSESESEEEVKPVASDPEKNIKPKPKRRVIIETVPDDEF